MTNEEIITQLQDIKCHCQEMYEAEIKNGDTSSNIWGKDVEALDHAIKKVEQQPCEDCISREELINELKLGYFNNDLQEGKNDPCVIDAMIDWAIRTIKRQPPVTPSYNSIKTELKPSEDCISREAVLEGLRTCYDTETKEFSDGSEWINYEDAIAEIEDIPSVKPQPKTGH